MNYTVTQTHPEYNTKYSTEPTEFYRPWGWYEILYTGEDCQVKKIHINPGERPSYQFHYKRDELWQILSGEGRIIIDGNEGFCFPGDYYSIRATQRHTI